MKAFFDTIRAAWGSLSQSQVDGLTRLVAATDGLPLMHQAYCLATCRHEGADTYQPITERGARAYFNKYEPGTRIGATLGNTIAGDGYRFRGRGDVMITGRRNYALASQKTGVDLVANPDRALDPGISARIMVSGMTEGWFTGDKLADYRDYVVMRRVVNLNDKAKLIAGYAKVFERALLARARDGVAVPPVLPPPVTPPPTPPHSAGPPRPVLTLGRVMAAVVAAIIAAAAAIFKFGGT